MKKLILTSIIILTASFVFGQTNVNISNVNALIKSSLVSSTAFENSHIIKDAPGAVIWFQVYNSLASAQFIQFFDSKTVPADTSVPKITFTVGASSNLTIPVDLSGIPFVNGIVIVNSTTAPTKTIGAANCFFSVVAR